MFQSFEDVSKYGKDFADTGLKSFASFSKGAQAISAEATDFSKKTYESNAAAIEKLYAAKSLDSAIEVQVDFAKKAYESFITEATRIGELYVDLAKQSFAPFESMAIRAK